MRFFFSGKKELRVDCPPPQVLAKRDVSWSEGGWRRRCSVLRQSPWLTSSHHCIKKAKVKKQKGEGLAAEISTVVLGRRGVEAGRLWAQHTCHFPPRPASRSTHGTPGLVEPGFWEQRRVRPSTRVCWFPACCGLSHVQLGTVTGRLVNQGCHACRGPGGGSGVGAEDPANWGPSCTRLCHTSYCSQAGRGQRTCPDPQANTDTMGLPRRARAVPFYSTGSPILKVPLWGQPGLWVSGTTAHRSRMGKTGVRQL